MKPFVTTLNYYHRFPMHGITYTHTTIETYNPKNQIIVVLSSIWGLTTCHRNPGIYNQFLSRRATRHETILLSLSVRAISSAVIDRPLRRTLPRILKNFSTSLLLHRRPYISRSAAAWSSLIGVRFKVSLLTLHRIATLRKKRLFTLSRASICLRR